MKKVFVIFVLVIILTPLVIAKGSSSYRTNQPIEEKCEDKSSLQERIQCRLDKGSSTDIPEACLGLTVQDECVLFYDQSAYCYDLVSSSKNDCFVKESGFEDESRKKWYITALLYEIQEYVEDDFGEGKLSSQEAAKLITKIIQMKRHALSGTPLSTIHSLLQDYKKERGVQN
jgi:hypothetical protein